MLANVRTVFVIQERNSGLFLSEELHWVRSLRRAGRCDDYEAAVDTGRMNTDGEFDIHRLCELID
ncbi:MAG: hypothetical protein QM803_18940 [Rhodocyclaceae bacterium]|uniref:hypothetical protein n=1 Tax=Uliginosibacterium sp. sgz301328 TaxID=3243764 RepID=UPI00359D92A9